MREGRGWSLQYTFHRSTLAQGRGVYLFHYVTCHGVTNASQKAALQSAVSGAGNLQRQRVATGAPWGHSHSMAPQLGKGRRRKFSGPNPKAENTNA